MSVDAWQRVCAISPDGLAYEAGVRSGDILRSFNGQVCSGKPCARGDRTTVLRDMASWVKLFSWINWVVLPL